MSAETVTLDQAIATTMQLPPEEREILLAVLRSRQIEGRRKEIADDAQESIAMFRSGRLKSLSSDQVIQELHGTVREFEKGAK
jgi:hypothetical protein